VQGLLDWSDATDIELTFVDVVVQNETGANASVEDAQRWADDQGITPQRGSVSWDVLGNGEEGWVNPWGVPSANLFNQHSYTLVDAEGVVVWRDEGNSSGGDQADVVIEAIEAAE
jgi:hypothetical protein